MNLNKSQHNTFKPLVGKSGASRCVLQTIPFPGKKKREENKNESKSKFETQTLNLALKFYHCSGLAG
jgi:hypothetical protein